MRCRALVFQGLGYIAVGLAIVVLLAFSGMFSDVFAQVDPDAPTGLDPQTARWLDAIANALMTGNFDWRVVLIPGLWIAFHFLKGKLRWRGAVVRVPLFSDWWDRRAWYARLAVTAGVALAIGLATTLSGTALSGAAVARGLIVGLGLAVGTTVLQGVHKAAS